MTNELADLVYATLTAIHPRVYRNRSLSKPDTPYVVFNAEGSTDTIPSKDYTVIINVYEKNDGSKTIREATDLADLIDETLNNIVLESDTVSVHLTEAVPRQFEDDPSLSGVQLIRLQYTGRTYRKE